jgi:hypothetical protein
MYPMKKKMRQTRGLGKKAKRPKRSKSNYLRKKRGDLQEATDDEACGYAQRQ